MTDIVDFYNKGMDALREHHEEICFRVMKSRNENKGNFFYFREDNDIKREENLARWLQFGLWKAYCDIHEITDKNHCDRITLCRDCTSKRFRFHSNRAPDHWCNNEPEGWYCQAECECK